MAPIAAVVIKEFRDQRLGIGMINSVSGAPVSISSIASDGLFANSGLVVGMQVLSINNIPTHDMTSTQAIQILKDAEEGQVVMVADNPIQAAVVASAPPMQSIVQGKKRGYIILKKTLKHKSSGNQKATEKPFTFHGPMTPEMVAFVNDKLLRLRLSNGANPLQFSINDTGHYHGLMNHAAQKYHEEDFVVAILEAMEELGYYFRFQYDAEKFPTTKTDPYHTGASYTSKELFIFHRME